MSGSRKYSLDELHAELRRFEAALRDAGLAETSVTTYVDRSDRFLRWLVGDYRPRGVEVMRTGPLSAAGDATAPKPASTGAEAAPDQRMLAFADALFQALRAMDSEADTIRNDEPTGLSEYGGHYQPHVARPRTEPCWTKRLGELLPELGFPTDVEVRYPNGSRKKCDLVVRLEDGRRLWLELKGAWRDYWAGKGNLWIYRSYLLHPLVEGLDASKTHTVPLDLEKLGALTAQDADLTAVLLVGFDRADDPMDADVASLVKLAGLADPPWSGAVARWLDSRRDGHRISCWLWWRSAREG